MPHSENPFRRFSRWVMEQIVQDVPENIALCELDCRKGQCSMGEWECCSRRITKAAGEFMPPEELGPAEEEAIKEGTMGDS